MTKDVLPVRVLALCIRGRIGSKAMEVSTKGMEDLPEVIANQHRHTEQLLSILTQQQLLHKAVLRLLPAHRLDQSVYEGASL